MSPDPMLDTFRPVVRAVSGVDLSDPDRARSELEARFDPAGEGGCALLIELRRLVEEGRLCDRGAPPVRWSRVAKAGEETAGLSIDVVRMDGAGPRHRHPAGEANLCFALSGEPTFDGRPAGWVVLPPDSEHVPTVAGGEMLIVYLLPGGAIEFL